MLVVENSNPKDVSSCRLRGKISNLVLSAPPQITSLLRPKEEQLVQKSYKTLTGIVGKLFWWYALRKNGEFIQKFSEKNLASFAENLGEKWTPMCVETAKAHQGRSRYSTFAFLAGSLNGGNLEILNALKTKHDLHIDIITGGDGRRNKATSWFWKRNTNSNVSVDLGLNTSEKGDEKNAQSDNATATTTTLFQFLKDNGFSVNEITVGGRRCPAHEDADGFARAMLSILEN
jgi:hypothetical protein